MMSKVDPLVSVIVPVYNAAETLNVCLDSIYGQTYSHMELVIVDDCSKDNTLEVVSCYVKESPRRDITVRLLKHEQNLGVAASRNTALGAASGEYLCYVDADDWIEPEMISTLVAAAEKEQADIVGADWLLSLDKKERYMSQRGFSTPKDALRNMMCGVMRWNLWLFLVKRSLYEKNGIMFLPGLNMGEDMMVTMRLFMKAEKVVYLPMAFYHYRKVNAAAVSNGFSERQVFEVTENLKRVEMAISDCKCGDDLSDYLNYLKQFIKLPLLMTDDETEYERWGKWFPESDPFIISTPMLSLRTKFIEYAAYRKWYFVLKIYHRLVYKVFYGIIYK